MLPVVFLACQLLGEGFTLSLKVIGNTCLGAASITEDSQDFSEIVTTLVNDVGRLYQRLSLEIYFDPFVGLNAPLWYPSKFVQEILRLLKQRSVSLSPIT